MTAAGLIFSNIHDLSLPELTSRRTLASVPFGCRYRLIDFPLSNMVNSGISKIGVVTHDNYQSLLDHIGTGKDWDLARRSGGIKILPPFITAFGDTGARHYNTSRLDSLIGVKDFLERCSEDVIVLSDCDIICNIDLSEVLDQHAETGAEITIVTCDDTIMIEKKRTEETYSVESDKNGVVTDITAYDPELSTSGVISTNILVINRVYLLSAINEAVSRGYNNLYRDVILKKCKLGGVYSYHYEHAALKVSSLESYFKASMLLLDEEIRDDLINVIERPIYTKLRNSAPTIYRPGCSVKNSYIADGCEIEGVVENSIIFRGVRIGKGSVVKNSVVLQGTYLGDNVNFNCVVADKDVVVKDGRNLSGHTTMPFFISKGTVV